MPRIPIPVSTAMLLMGAAVIPPVILDTFERDGLSRIGLGFASIGCLSIVCGLAALVPAIRRRTSPIMPSGARLVMAVNILFLAFFSLEFSDLMVRQEGKLDYWTNVLFLPALILFWGLLTTRRWAWWFSRGLAALGVLWFLGFAVLIPFGNIQRDGVPASWEARAYMICISLGFASILMCAFWSIGRPETRSYFGLSPGQNGTAR